MRSLKLGLLGLFAAFTLRQNFAFATADIFSRDFVTQECSEDFSTGGTKCCYYRRDGSLIDCTYYRPQKNDNAFQISMTGWRFVHWENCTPEELKRGYSNGKELYCTRPNAPETCSNRAACFRFWEPSHFSINNEDHSTGCCVIDGEHYCGRICI